MLRRVLLVVMTAMVLMLTGCQAGTVSKVISKPDLKPELAKAFGPADQKWQVGEGWVALSPVRNDSRELGYLAKSGSEWQMRGTKQTVPAGAQVKLDGDLVVVQTQRGGAPQFASFSVDANGLVAANYYAARAPEPEVKTGHFVLVNKQMNTLWHFQEGKLVKTYRVGTGRQTEPPTPTWQDYKTNFFTPEGLFTLTNFAENPPYNALKPGDKSFAGGAPGNPLGTRWMGFSVLNGDNAWVWGIHGTSEPEKIGTWVSDGCIRMETREAEALFAALKGKNAKLRVVGK